MAKPQRPQDLYVVNGWYLEIPVPGIGSNGLFETLEGIQKQSGSVDIVDAGSNRRFRFTDQLMDYGEMSLTRTYQGNVTDRALEILVNTCIEEGLKLPVRAVKMHQGREVLTVVFEGFRFNAVNYPALDVNSGEKFTVSYAASCDGWAIIPTSID